MQTMRKRSQHHEAPAVRHDHVSDDGGCARVLRHADEGVRAQGQHENPGVQRLLHVPLGRRIRADGGQCRELQC